MAYITLNKSNFFDNLDVISKKTKGVDKIALVLKDNAYGHGICDMASLAKEYGVTKAVVRSNEEAKKIENFFEYILVLSDIPQSFSDKIRYTINCIDSIRKFPKGTLVELKVNTGMNRNGININDLDFSISEIQKQGLKLEAVFTHHSCADELNEHYSIQKKNFEAIKNNLPDGIRFHSCNSAALLREKDFSEDMARVGIAAYGCIELPPEISTEKFKPVLSVYAQKISSRTVAKGESVGYGATYTADKKSIVSNYDFGYGDGFFRSLSNTYFTPENIGIAGRISMDNSSFLTDDEELLIFDDARDICKVAGTISYEVLTSLKAYIKRIVI